MITIYNTSSLFGLTQDLFEAQAVQSEASHERFGAGAECCYNPLTAFTSLAAHTLNMSPNLSLGPYFSTSSFLRIHHVWV